jgi:rod shape-determining protein MreD
MRSAIYLAMLGGSGLAQSTVVPYLRVANVTPDIPFILTVLLGLRRGPEVGCLTGFALGLIQDVAGGEFVGAQALTKGLVGFLVGLLGGRFQVSHPLVQIPGLVLLTVGEGIARYGLLRLFHFPVGFGDLMVFAVLPQSLFNGFIGAAVVLGITLVEIRRSGSL